MDLFDDETPGGIRRNAPPIEARPLAQRLRPAALADVVGQEHPTGPDASPTRMVDARRLSSIIMWGPPGVGKTTIARLLAELAGMRFVTFSRRTSPSPT